ncbi:hypothetical protein JTE90_007183 [Oedothorax gibbosus]|uniref:Uncharacterized protein n=1 Tax=Oedothorax gibbosus TaxID=931172 RepID=A0AAV6UW26_9ARAC|nr:hypothetical protein JTE90_007183 [Oedothorax gibbosus]
MVHFHQRIFLKMHSSLIITVSLSILVVFLTSTNHQVHSNPIQYSKWDEYVRMSKDEFLYSKDNKCRHGGEVRNLCEKCAKVTKNEVVFPLCCQDKKGVASWCREFLDYRPVEPALSS